MNKKGIIILICTGVVLLLGSLCTTFYALSRMNKVEDILVFSTETTTVPETTVTTNVPETTITTNVPETTTTTIVTTSPEVTTVTEELDVIEAVPNNNNNNNNNDDAMTRGQWYEENGYGGAPEQEESFDHDEFLSMKNSDEGARFSGNYLTTIDLPGSTAMSESYSYMKNGEAIVGVDTGINVGDTIYVVEIGYFTVVELSDSIFREYDKVVRCYSDDLFYGDDGYLRTVFRTDVYIIGD